MSARIARLAAVGAMAAAAALAFGGNTAFAWDGPGNVAPILSGDQVSVPVNVCGLSVAVLGIADSGCVGGAEVENEGGGANGDILPLGSGNTVSAPVNVCGTSVGVLGSADSGCRAGSAVITHEVPCAPPCQPCCAVPPISHVPVPHLPVPHRNHHQQHKPKPHHHAHQATTPRVPPKRVGPLSAGVLPTTGANVLGLLGAGLTALAVGAGALLFGRRRSAA